MRTFLSVIAVIAAVALTGAAWLVFLASGSTLKPLVEWTGGMATGEAVAIGALSIDRGRVTRVSASDVSIGSEGAATRIDALEFDVDISSLFGERPIFEKAALRGAEFTISSSGGEAGGEVSLPVVREFSLSDVTIVRSAPVEGDETESFEVRIDEASGDLLAGEASRLSGTGVFREEAFEFSVTAGDASAYAAGGETPIEISVDGALTADASTTVRADGSTSAIDFSVEGPTLAALRPFVITPLPDTPPFSLSGAVSIEADGYDLTGIEGAVGDSDVAGDVKVSFSGPTPAVSGELRSSRLFFADVMGLLGYSADGSAGGGGFFPDTPIPEDRLRALRLDLEFVADDVEVPFADIAGVDAKILLADDRLTIKPLAIGVAGGEAKGAVAVNLRQATPSADVDLAFSGVAFDGLLPDNQLASRAGGTISGDVYLLGVGSSLADILGSARGGGRILLEDGEAPALVIEGLGLDVAEAIGVAVSGGAPVSLPCAGVAFTAADGTADIDAAEALTEESVIRLAGSVGLRSLEYRLTAEAR
ncbi:MAG: AsmA family protein, partial [Pseudomonadota bacterium]